MEHIIVLGLLFELDGGGLGGGRGSSFGSWHLILNGVTRVNIVVVISSGNILSCVNIIRVIDRSNAEVIADIGIM